MNIKKLKHTIGDLMIFMPNTANVQGVKKAATLLV